MKINTEQAAILQVKQATCRACGGWVYQAAYPRCKESKDANREFTRCLKAEMNINVLSLAEAREVPYCSCRLAL